LPTPDPTIVAQLPLFTAGEDRRRHRRHEVTWLGRIHASNGTLVECAVLDLSAEGAKVILGDSVAVGARVTFVSPRFDPVTAQIVWTDDQTAGLQFLDGVDCVMLVLAGKYGDIALPVQLEMAARDSFRNP
jgi:hypothetical protein